MPADHDAELGVLLEKFRKLSALHRERADEEQAFLTSIKQRRDEITAAVEAAHQCTWLVEKRIMETPARSHHGIAAKLEAFDIGGADEMQESILTDIRRLGVVGQAVIPGSRSRGGSSRKANGSLLKTN